LIKGKNLDKDKKKEGDAQKRGFDKARAEI
jgi:hypothetical protein